MKTNEIISETASGSFINCRIQPAASKTSYIGIHDGALKFSLAAPPVEGKANKVFCTFLAKQLKIPKSAVKIHSGEKSRNKTVFCENRTKAEITNIFNIK